MTTPPRLEQGQNPFSIGQESLTTISYGRRKLKMFVVLRQELDTLIAGFTSVYWALFGVTAGAATTTIITVCTVSLSDQTNRKFFDASVILGIATVTFLCLGLRDLAKSRKVVSQIKEETIDVDIKGS